MRITYIMLTVLLPAMLLAAPGTEFAQTSASTHGTVTVVNTGSSSLSVTCKFDPTWMNEVTEPEDIPALTRWIIVDGDGLPTIVSTSSTLLDGDGTELIRARSSTDFSDAVEVGEPIIQRGVRLVPVTFRSVTQTKNNSQECIASITTEIEIPQGNMHSKQMRPVLEEMWGDLILNREQPSRDRDNESTGGLYVYVIPDNNDVRNRISPLIQWRRQQGYLTREISCPDWANADFVMQQLLNIDMPETPIDYILLAGDVLGNFPVPTPFRGIESDYYYTFLNGEDRIPDAAVGRISYNSLAELERIVDKILNYEQHPEFQDEEWLRRGAVVAGSRISGYSSILVSKWLRDQLIFNDFTSVDTLWYTMGRRIGDFMEREFNRGVAYVSYRGWTGLEDWSPIEAGALRNHYLPTAILLACNSGDYAGQQTGFTEALLRAQGGAIAAIGVAGAQSRINFNNAMLASYFRGVLDNGIYRIGWALNHARVELMATYGSRERELTVDHSAWTNLMGDPATIIWRGMPQEVRITAAQEISYGLGMFNVTVVDPDNNQPVVNARVGFSKGNEVVSAAITDEDGQATIRFDNRRVSPGAGTITVSGDKIVPASTQIQLSRPNQTLVLQAFNVQEDNRAPRRGDGNGMPEPNEIFGVTVSLLNIGSQAIPSPTDCQLSTESEFVDIQEANYRIQQAINPNSAASASFQILAGSDFPDRENVRFMLVARQGESEWSLVFDIAGQGARWTVVRTDLANPPAPNEMPFFDIFLKNSGSVDLGITDAVLFSDSENAEVFEGEGRYDTLMVGETGSTGQQVYQVLFDENALFGSLLPFHLQVTCEGNYTANLPFTIEMAQLPVGQPTGPDSYGYYAIDQQDFGVNLRPNHRWEEINPRLEGFDGVNTGLLDQGEDDDESVVVNLPFPVQYYGENFDEITICTNGWAAFGNQSGYVDFRDMPIGSPQGPRAQLCPWWSDLYQPGVDAGVFTYHDAPRHRFIIEWYKMRQWVGPAGPGGVETFEIIINDPAWYQNTTGDGDIYFVYNEVTHEGRVDAHGTPYATVGIGSPDDKGGLQLAFWNKFEPGVTPPNAGVVYRFMTATSFNFATLQGTVRREGGNQPVQGAIVRATRGGWTTSDANGVFRIQAIIAGLDQQAEVTANGYNRALSNPFNAETGDTVVVAILLREPQIVSDVDAITDSLQAGDIVSHIFHLRNPGNGNLTVSVGAAEHIERGLLRQRPKVTADRDETSEFGDRLLSIPVTERTGDSRIIGVAHDGENFIVSGGDNGGEENVFYRFDEAGDYIDRHNQPVDDIWGMRDLAWVGGNLYGGVGESIIKMGAQGREISRIASPIIPARGLAVSPGEDYWISGEEQPILKLNSQGETLRSYPTNLDIYGLAWHPADKDGYPLWIFANDGLTGLFVCKMDTASGEFLTVMNIDSQQGDRPGGIELTRKWDDRLWCLQAVIQNPAGDRVDLFDVGNNFAWISVEPGSAQLAPNASVEFTLLISSDGLEREEYIADILIEHDAAGGELRIPVHVYVEPVLAGVDPERPTDFSLESVFPNPANGSAKIRFYLPVAGQTSLQVFDSQGRMVSQIADRPMSAGYHSDVFEAASLPAGVYLITLHSGDKTFVQKFALVK